MRVLGTPMSLKIVFLTSKNYSKLLNVKNIIVVPKEPHPNRLEILFRGPVGEVVVNP